MEGIVYIVLGIAAVATLAFLLHNKYVLWGLYAVVFVALLYGRFPELWGGEIPIYHKLGVSITLIVASVFGLLLAIKVVEFVTPEVVVGTKFGILDAKFTYGLINLLAPVITMVVLGLISTGAYLSALK
jgi:hypothetical protein